MASSSRKLICPKCYRSCYVTRKMLLICGYCDELLVYAPSKGIQARYPKQDLSDSESSQGVVE